MKFSIFSDISSNNGISHISSNNGMDLIHHINATIMGKGVIRYVMKYDIVTLYPYVG